MRRYDESVVDNLDLIWCLVLPPYTLMLVSLMIMIIIIQIYPILQYIHDFGIFVDELSALSSIIESILTPLHLNVHTLHPPPPVMFVMCQYLKYC